MNRKAYNILSKPRRKVGELEGGLDLAKLKSDFLYYAPNCLKIQIKPPVDKNLKVRSEAQGRLIPFELNTPQRIFHGIWEEQLSTKGRVRLLVLKARQFGISTYTQGRGFQMCHMNHDTGGLVLAHDTESAEYIFSISRRYYDNLPKDIRPMIRYNTKRVLDLDNPSDSARAEVPGLRSIIEVHSAGKRSGVVSRQFTWGHYSEVSRWKSPEILISVNPMIPDAPGTAIVMESTAYGMDGILYPEWRLAEDGGSMFKPVFMPWFIFEDYSTDFASEEEREAFRKLVGTDSLYGIDEELELVNKFNCSLEQLYWRRKRIVEFKYNLDAFKQEYPSTAEEAFIASGSPIFNSAKLKLQITKCVSKPLVGVMNIVGKFEGVVDGWLKLWHRPDGNYRYVIGADIASGDAISEDSDWSTGCVLRIPENPGEPYLQVAELTCKHDPIAFALLLCNVAKWYNDAILAIEANSYGMSTIMEAKKIYYNLYKWKYIDKQRDVSTERIGFYTNVSTAPVLANLASYMLATDRVVLRSKDLLDEMQVFTRKNTGKGEAEAGYHDDHVYAFMIALFVGETEYTGGDRVAIVDGRPVEVKQEDVSIDQGVYNKRVNLGVVEQQDDSWLAL